MAIIRCKMCGGDLNLVEGSSTAECEFCGSVQTVPKVDDEKKLTLFARANRLRSACEFDKAAGVYESIVADFPEEPEAYWGLVLCKYGIEYVDDPGGKKVPTCHRSSFETVMEDSDFEQALENADSVARKVYREEAKQIEEIRKGIIAVSANEDPYDIFICYKETAEDGDRTLDSVLAQDIYDALTDKGYRVFFSRVTLEDKLGVEYEPYIFAALNSAKIMLAVGTDYEYYNAVWVKNEWSRYLKLMAKDKGKHLIPCYKNLDAYDMPKEFAKLQAQDLGKVGAMQDLLRGVEKILPRTASAPSAAVANSGQVSIAAALLRRGMMALEDAQWDKADMFFEDVLNSEPECTQAYVGKFLAKQQYASLEQLSSKVLKETEEAQMDKMKVGANLEKLERYREEIQCHLEKHGKVAQEYFGNIDYFSAVPCRRRHLWKEKQRWEESAEINRALQFADEKLKAEIINIRDGILRVMEERLERALAEEERLFQEENPELAAKVAKISKLLRDEFSGLSNRYATKYAGACRLMETAKIPAVLRMARQEFLAMGAYRDCEERAVRCAELEAEMRRR